jgi:hypothetical protein
MQAVKQQRMGTDLAVFDSSLCKGYLIDVGANVGDSLRSFYTKPSCAVRPGFNQTPGIALKVSTSKCAWQWPWWMQLPERRTHCVYAIEPNVILEPRLQSEATALRQEVGNRIRIFPRVALSIGDGNATFGLDKTHPHGVGSSLHLHRHTMGLDSKGAYRKGAGPALADGSVAIVKKMDAVALLRTLPRSLPVALKIDVEGHEYELLRDLLITGALCKHVDSLFVEWHSTAEGLPGTPRSLDQAMQWMLSTHNPRWSELSKEWRPIGGPVCRTTLLKWD